MANGRWAVRVVVKEDSQQLLSGYIGEKQAISSGVDYTLHITC